MKKEKHLRFPLFKKDETKRWIEYNEKVRSGSLATRQEVIADLLAKHLRYPYSKYTLANVIFETAKDETLRLGNALTRNEYLFIRELIPRKCRVNPYSPHLTLRPAEPFMFAGHKSKMRKYYYISWPNGFTPCFSTSETGKKMLDLIFSYTGEVTYDNIRRILVGIYALPKVHRSGGMHLMKFRSG